MTFSIIRIVRLPVFVLFLSSEIAFGQNGNFDKVNITAIPFKYDYAIDNINADFVRSHPVYTFVSIDTSFINSLFAKIFSVEGIPKSDVEAEGGIRVVIDFISKNQIKSFVLINTRYEFYCVSSYSNEAISFQTINENKCFIKDCIPFANSLDYGLEKCK